MAQRFVGGDRDQEWLLPPSMREWLPEDHLAWFVLDAVEQFDLSAFFAAYRQDGWGRPAFCPQMMLGVLLYAYSIGERSSRGIERRLREDVAFRVLSGNVVPDHATIGRFRQRHERAIGDLFNEVLRLCGEAGLVRVGIVAIDGTKIAGNAALSANRTNAQLREEVDRILEEAARIDAAEDEQFGEARGDELPPELADRRSRLARLRAAKERLDAHVVADRERYERHVAQRRELEAERGRSLRGRKPRLPITEPPANARANPSDPDTRILKGQHGFVQGYNAQAAVTDAQIVIAAEVVDESNDTRQLAPMTRAARESLTAAGIGEEIGCVLGDAGYWNRPHLKALAADGIDALVSPDRGRSPGPERPPRELGRGSIAEWMRERITGPDKDTYARRKQLVEPVFGQTKHNRRIDRIYRRGRPAAQMEWRLACMTHNLLKLHRHRLAAG